MLISHQRKFIFIHIYKNAGSSIEKALLPFALPRWQYAVNKGFGFFRLEKPFKSAQPLPSRHYHASSIINLIGADKFSDFYSFAIVRNPWDWLASQYSYILRKKDHKENEKVLELGGFKNFVEYRCSNTDRKESRVRLQKDFISDSRGNIVVDFVGRYENLQYDFAKICSSLDIEAELPWMNKSSSGDVFDQYDSAMIDMVHEAYLDDIETFGYNFEAVTESRLVHRK